MGNEVEPQKRFKNPRYEYTVRSPEGGQLILVLGTSRIPSVVAMVAEGWNPDLEPWHWDGRSPRVSPAAPTEFDIAIQTALDTGFLDEDVYLGYELGRELGEQYRGHYHVRELPPDAVACYGDIDI